MNSNRHTWNLIRKDINGVGFDISHHGGMIGGTPWTDNNSMMSKIKSIYFDSLDNGEPIPRYWIRAHLHRYMNVQFGKTAGIIQGVVLPSFQLKTGYVYKKLNGRRLPCDIGMYWVNVFSDGTTRDGVHLARIQQDEISQW